MGLMAQSHNYNRRLFAPFVNQYSPSSNMRLFIAQIDFLFLQTRLMDVNYGN